jgi:hypothetical protein
MTPQEDAENIINEQVILPAGSYILDEDAETDESVEITSEPNGVSRIYGGNKMKVSIPFNSDKANVVGAGMRFGKNGKIHVIPIPEAKGSKSGTLSFDFQIPPEICEELSRICHDIKCYEFAVTDIGNISKENINDLALMCGNCDEPSCKGLVDCDYNYKVWWSINENSYEVESLENEQVTSKIAKILISDEIHLLGLTEDLNSVSIRILNISSLEAGKTYKILDRSEDSIASSDYHICQDEVSFTTNPWNGDGSIVYGGELTITSLRIKNENVFNAEGTFNFKAKNILYEKTINVTGGFSLNL